MKCEPRPRDFAPGLCPDQSVQQLQMIRNLLEMSTQASKFFFLEMVYFKRRMINIVETRLVRSTVDLRHLYEPPGLGFPGA